MAESLTGGQKIHASVQSTAGGVDFDGAAPSTTAAVASRVLTWPEDAAHAGLFAASVLNAHFASVQIDQIQLCLVGGTGYTVSIVRADGTAHVIATAAALSNVYVVIQGPFYLTAGEGLKIVTTGAAGINKAYAKVIHRFWNPVGTY
jgi:hypothetical protein